MPFNGRVAWKPVIPSNLKNGETKCGFFWGASGFSLSETATNVNRYEVPGEPNVEVVSNVIIEMRRIVSKNINHKIFMTTIFLVYDGIWSVWGINLYDFMEANKEIRKNKVNNYSKLIKN